MNAVATAWPPRYDRGYRPAAGEPYWDRARETMSTDERDALVLAKIQAGDATWESMVPPQVAGIIRERGLFGYKS